MLPISGAFYFGLGAVANLSHFLGFAAQDRASGELKKLFGLKVCVRVLFKPSLCLW